MERRWAGDVVVVGAGASGLIIAQRLVDVGLSVTILERGLVGGEQSNHSHGYMHRGHIYLTPSLELVKSLSTGADRWRVEMDALGIEPILDTSSLLFTSAYEADVAAAAWSRAGLTFDEETDTPPGVTSEGLSRTFSTREATFDFSAWLLARHERLANDPAVTIVQAEVLRLERDSTSIVGVVISRGGEEFVLVSSFVILCAGIGNLELAETVTRFRGNAVNRVSPMAVLRGPELPALSAVFHGHETHGMFIASRRTDEGWVWLASNYVSFAGETITPDAARLWLRDIRTALAQRTTALADSRNVWGYYAATKGELRNIRSSINSHNVQSYGIDNLLVAAPTKLTLAPLLGDLVMEEVDLRLRHFKRPADARDVEPGPALRVSPERWTAAALEPLSSFMDL